MHNGMYYIGYYVGEDVDELNQPTKTYRAQPVRFGGNMSACTTSEPCCQHPTPRQYFQVKI